MNEEQPITSQRSDFWRTARLGRFTASEFHKLMTEPRSKEAKANGELSDGAKTYVLDKIAEDLTGMSKDFQNDATVFGIQNEELARKVYMSTTPFAVTECDFITYGDNAGGSPDGFVGDEGMIEIKCPWNSTEHLKHCLITSDEYLKDEFAAFYWQMQCNLLFTGRQWCDFVSFDPRIEGQAGIFIHRVEFNSHDGATINAKLITAVNWKNRMAGLIEAGTNKIKLAVEEEETVDNDLDFLK